MATITMTRPLVSSPLADSSNESRPSAKRMLPTRNVSFPSSRALRPFPSVSHVLQPSSKKSPTVKLIEPPKNHKLTFTLDLTQAEFSRQD